jgi:ribulose-5-phosphate 4-epimerase/fuculose-1-phosphate aldolase
VGGERSVHVRAQNADKILVAELDGNRFHGRPTCTVYIHTGVHRFYINLGAIQKF